MLKKFEEPKLEVTAFELSDVITTSGGIGIPDASLPGATLPSIGGVEGEGEG